jgi:hypothetical protein
LITEIAYLFIDFFGLSKPLKDRIGICPKNNILAYVFFSIIYNIFFHHITSAYVTFRSFRAKQSSDPAFSLSCRISVSGSNHLNQFSLRISGFKRHLNNYILTSYPVLFSLFFFSFLFSPKFSFLLFLGEGSSPFHNF